MKTLLESIQTIVELAVSYLSALPPTVGKDGREWPDSIAITSGRGGIESLAKFVARECDVTVAFAEALVTAAATAHPDTFTLRYMKGKDGLVLDRQGEPILTIALRATGGSAAFVPGQTKFPARKQTPDASVNASAPAADATSL